MGGKKIDTRSSTGKLMLTMLAAVAAFERDLMLERQREGIPRRRQTGSIAGGHPRHGARPVRYCA
jgi:DNA invertase Pin-like site-specific DNA recombinase